jgi:hypothetical protein
VNHPMTNGNVEHANGIILHGIKSRIFDRLKAYDKKSQQCYGQCARHLVDLRVKPHSSLCTAPKQYFPLDLRLKPPRVLMFSKEEEPEHRYLDLMLLEEERDIAAY